ncbi:MAG: aminodeoxychorismate/anthranilate synthase component II [Candidatus Promineifilaceae bacterium]
MLVMIDNYDSFTYNIVQYLGELGANVMVFRNDKVTLQEIQDLSPDRIVISPGPGDPAVDGGVSNEVIRELGPETPILGVCLGHQCIGQVYGGTISRAERLMHGKTSSVYHNGKGLYTGVPSPFKATRYHSLIVEDPVPECLEVTAFTRDGEIMGLKHKEHPVQGVQFHPESILTEHGKRILLNFLEGR